VVTVRNPWTLTPCRMIAVIVNGKSCIVLYIEVPPYESRRVGRNVIAARNRE
jgi:hypothetical protein